MLKSRPREKPHDQRRDIKYMICNELADYIVLYFTFLLYPKLEIPSALCIYIQNILIEKRCYVV